MIGSDIAGPTSLGTGTTKTQLGGADLVLPAWARSILAVRPTLTIDDATIDESVMGYLTLESDDFAIQPFQALCNPIEAAETTGTLFAGEPPWYPLNCNINGGDRIKIYGTALIANTAAPMMSCQIIMSDRKMSGQLHGKVGTITATGTTAAVNVNEASYTLTGGKVLTEILGAVGVLAPTSPDSIAGRFEFLSNDFKEPTPLKLPVHPICGQISNVAGSASTPGLSRAKIEVPILSPCQLTNNLNMAVASAGNGKFITGVMYK